MARKANLHVAHLRKSSISSTEAFSLDNMGIFHHDGGFAMLGRYDYGRLPSCVSLGFYVCSCRGPIEPGITFPSHLEMIATS